MIPREILEKVRRIELNTKGLVREIFSGEYHSVFKGRGMEFAEVREYMIGDDIRNIDWNVSARMDKLYVKQFDEERELTVILAVDISSSGDFGSHKQLKREIAAELCAIIAFSAINNNDKVGLVMFTDEVEKYIPPRKGKKHVLRVIRELLYFKPGNTGTNIKNALGFINRTTKRRATLFLVSDFIDNDFEKDLRVLKKKHDIIATQIIDPLEELNVEAGWMDLLDPESGNTYTVNTNSRSFRALYAAEYRRFQKTTDQVFKNYGIDTIKIHTNENYVDPIVRFFKMRGKRKRAHY